MDFFEKKWWKEAIGYQIYPKSFYDSNDDGIGDIRGIIEKLDYLAHLGVNLLWLCPFYQSPMDDNGYDVSDYYNIALEFGTLEDVKELIQKAHEKGIKIIADLVLNHTSDEHAWFMESRKSKDNKYRDYYIWQPPRFDESGKEIEPTNWASFFGGSCWQKDPITQEYYMKIFSNKMPDLNWENPALRNDMFEMARWWLDQGIDGFRVDAVAHLARGGYEDSTMDAKETYKPDWRKFSNLPKLHDYLQEFYEQVIKDYDVMTVGEVGGGALPEEAIHYAGLKRNELHMVFNFDHNWCNNAWDIKDPKDLKLNLPHLKDMFKKWQTGLYGKAWNPLYWLNHDQPRVMSHYGDVHNPKLSGKMLATALYFMWGTPFIYNGEEIGMTNYPFESIDDFNDVSIHTNYRIQVLENHKDEAEFIKESSIRTRDNARTPMQWSDEAYGGFSTSKPWMKVNPNYRFVNVKHQIDDEDSLFNYYRRVIELRKNPTYKDTLVYGSYRQILLSHPHVYAYIREYKNQKVLVLVNFFNQETEVDLHGYVSKQTLLSNYHASIQNLEHVVLRPYEAVVVDIS